MLIVEQNAVATLDVVNRAYLIENGRVVMGGTAAELKANPDIQAFYLGGAGTKDPAGQTLPAAQALAFLEAVKAAADQ